MGKSSFYVAISVYGISELLDFDESHTVALLRFLSRELPINSELLIVDPVSLEFLNEKEALIKTVLSCDVEWNELFHGQDKVSVSRSIIEPYILTYCNSLHLLINRDIKFSCHTWAMYLSKQSAREESKDIRLDVNAPTCLILTQPICVPEWVSKLRAAIQTSVWTIDDVSAQNRAMIDRLCKAWRRFGGILILPYARYVW